MPLICGPRVRSLVTDLCAGVLPQLQFLLSHNSVRSLGVDQHRSLLLLQLKLSYFLIPLSSPLEMGGLLLLSLLLLLQKQLLLLVLLMRL